MASKAVSMAARSEAGRPARREFGRRGFEDPARLDQARPSVPRRAGCRGASSSTTGSSRFQSSRGRTLTPTLRRASISPFADSTFTASRSEVRLTPNAQTEFVLARQHIARPVLAAEDAASQDVDEGIVDAAAVRAVPFCPGRRRRGSVGEVKRHSDIRAARRPPGLARWSIMIEHGSPPIDHDASRIDERRLVGGEEHRRHRDLVGTCRSASADEGRRCAAARPRDRERCPNSPPRSAFRRSPARWRSPALHAPHSRCRARASVREGRAWRPDRGSSPG